jgi:lipopolysaccharide export system protein LptA
LATFTGGVTLKKETMTLTADHLVVYYDAVDKGVREIEARDNVVVRQEGRVAMANKAVYYSKDEKIILTGEPRIIENENQLGGERITLFMRSERSIVEGGKVLIYQDKVDDKKAQRPVLKKSK